MSSRRPAGVARSRSLAVIRRLRSRVSRQSAIARLGEKALTSFDVDAVCGEAARLIASALAVDSCTVLELLPDQRRLRLRAAQGAVPGQSVEGLIDLESAPHFGRALTEGGPVLLQDLRADARASLLPFSRNASVGSGVLVAIPGPERPLGVVATHTVARRAFAEDDVSFLRAMANVLGTALHRRRSEEAALRLAAVVECSEDAIIGKTLEGTITSWNTGAERLYGFSADEVVGKSISVIIPDSRPNEMNEILDRLKRGERIDHFETSRVRKDGSLVYVSVSISPLRDGSGTLIGAATIARDITERRRVEQALRGTNERLRIFARIVESIPDFVAVVDHDHVFRMANLAYARALGLSVDDLIGRRTSEVLEGKLDWESAEAHLDRCLTGEPVAEEGWQSFPDGQRRFLEVRYLPLADEIGPDLAVILARDSTERRQAERFRDEFLNLAAHELRTPLTTMRGYAQILTRHGGHDVDEKRLFRSLSAQTDRLTHLVQTLIDVSRIQSGDLVLFRRPIDLVALAAATIAEVAPSAPRHDLSLRAPEAVEVVADAKRVSDVIFSLLDNAIKYSPRGGTIAVSVARVGESAVFRVADEGIGIAPDKQAELFSQFYQVAPMISPTTGMGLGLFISREIVRRHGGQIWFDSEEGVGSTFSFGLPIHPVP